MTTSTRFTVLIERRRLFKPLALTLLALATVAIAESMSSGSANTTGPGRPLVAT